MKAAAREAASCPSRPELAGATAELTRPADVGREAAPPGPGGQASVGPGEGPGSAAKPRPKAPAGGAGGAAAGAGGTPQQPGARRQMPAAGGRPSGAAPGASRRGSGAPPVSPADASALRPNRQGLIRMRGRTDSGKGWQQEIDLELAKVLVEEKAAVVVNPHTIRRLYTSKGFRRYILNRDRYICYFCGGPGDTIDHLLPRAKGGHTTPDNCVCACNLCNQMKADKDAEEFMKRTGEI
ncbi:hypothetical protein J22TS3_23030 [Paenibacillus sp. J22TS3]|nr:hypothetical protein J22TS3_23030 [Paenibacillus sp. J22TS3]